MLQSKAKWITTEWTWTATSKTRIRVRTTVASRIWTVWTSRSIKRAWKASNQLWRHQQIKFPMTTQGSCPQIKTSMVSIWRKARKKTQVSLIWPKMSPLQPMEKQHQRLTGKQMQLEQVNRTRRLPNRSLMHQPRHRQTMLKMVVKRHLQPQSNNKMSRRITTRLLSSEE